MIKPRGLLLIILFVFLSVNAAYLTSAGTHVISNSENWRDVYSSVLYANLLSAGSDFLVSTRHGTLLIPSLNKEDNIQIITSSKQPFVINYADMLRSKGFGDVEELSLADSNLELVQRLENINNFVIVGNMYGFNGIAVAPYAKITNSWVFFADKTNIAEIDSVMSTKNPKKVILYGSLDREVLDAMTKYNPEIINTGDRFKDDIEIVKKYLEISPTKQVIFTNGEFIERSLMDGTQPILFTGKENVPDEIKDYLKTSSVEVGVLVGSDLVGAATNIRRTTGVNVIVKFARGARAPTGAVSAVEGLDLFYLPTPIMKLSIVSAKYNRATSMLELTYKSESNVPIYFQGTLTPEINSEKMPKFGDNEPIFISPNDYRTMTYTDFQYREGNLTLGVYTLYGITPSSLEKVLEAMLKVETVNVIDKCEIDLLSAKYNKQKSTIYVKVANKADTDCWVDVEIKDIVIEKQKKIIGTEGAILLSKGGKKNIAINQALSADDIVNNPVVDVTAFYGEREDSLVKVIEGKFPLSIEILTVTTIILIVIALIVLLLVIFFIWKRRREKEEDEMGI